MMARFSWVYYPNLLILISEFFADEAIAVKDIVDPENQTGV